MSTFAPVREAYELWLLTAPQLTLDLELRDATKPSWSDATVPSAASGRPAAPSPTTEGAHRG